MLKTSLRNAYYEPNKRSLSWLKLKKDYLSNAGVGDTFDLVPVGAFWGTGRRAGWFGTYLLAVYDPDSEELHCVCKCMSGMFSIVVPLHVLHSL